MNTGTRHITTYDNQSTTGSNLTDAVVDTMVRWPMRVTGATVDFMLQGVRQMTGAAGSSSRESYGNGSSATYESTTSSSGGQAGSGTGSTLGAMFSGSTSGTFDQNLGGDDLKYVIWSIVFTKPGYECILEKQQEELVNYAADSNTYAAVKIAKFLDGARHGHLDKPEDWRERGYPSETAKTRSARKESMTVVSTPSSTTVASSVGAAPSMETRNHTTSGAERDRHDQKESGDKGWRIPAEDQKYITFLYKVDRRLAKQEEVTRVERVTVERNTQVVSR